MSTLVVICGLSFAGKSTLARAITERLGLVEVDVDEVGAVLYGVAIGDPATLDGLDFDRIYDEADKELERLLASEVSVVDASRNFTRAERARARQLAQRADARLVTVFVDTPEGVARQRRQDNKASGSRRDITDDQFEEIVRAFEPPSEDECPLVFGINDEVASWTTANASALEPRWKRHSADTAAYHPAVPFPGFPKDAPRFLADLSRHNDRAWFQAHRQRYEDSYLAPAEEFVLAMGEQLRKLSRDVRYEPKINASISRINRDVRFSKDKRPYKDHLDLWFWQGEDRKASAGYWFSLRPKELHLGAGLYMFSPEILERYRAAVLDGRHGVALAKALAATTKAGYKAGGSTHKRVPSGYDPNHPRADLLKRTGLYVYASPRLPAETFTPRFVAFCLAHWRKMAPVQDWLATLAG